MQIIWEVFNGSWIDIGSNRLEFSNSSTNINAIIPLATFQQGTHLVNGSPGSDVCGAEHLSNNKLTNYNKAIFTPAGQSVLPENFINDASLISSGTGLNGDFRQATFRIHLVNSLAVRIQNAKLYSFDGVSTNKPAKNLDIGIWVVGNNMTKWYTLNSDSDLGPAIAGMDFTVNDVGGIVSGFNMQDQSAAINHYYPVAMSVAPEVAGNITACALGFYAEWF